MKLAGTMKESRRATGDDGNDVGQKIETGD